MLPFGGKKKPPRETERGKKRLSLQPDFPTDDVNEALRHLLRLVNRVAALAGSDGALSAELTKLRADAGRATLPEDYEQLCDHILALELGSALSSLEGHGDPRAVLRDAIEAVMPVARAIRGDGPALGLARLLRDADNPRLDLRREFYVQMERLTEAASWLRAASDVFKVATLDVLAALSRLTGDEGQARLRLIRLRDGIEHAGNIADLQALRETLLQETNSLVQEATMREGRLSSIRSQVDRVQAHVASLENALADANQMALTDPLTGLGNRRALDTRVQRLAESSRETGILALDIDHFKRINDNYGHDAGDLVIRRMADVLREELRGNDAMFRTGGEEFVALLPGTDTTAAQGVAERIRQRFAETVVYTGDREIRATVSAGVAPWTARATFKQAIKRADEALYNAKRGGRNRVCTARA